MAYYCCDPDTMDPFEKRRRIRTLRHNIIIGSKKIVPVIIANQEAWQRKPPGGRSGDVI
jgi:hypothetical protein